MTSTVFSTVSLAASLWRQHLGFDPGGGLTRGIQIMTPLQSRALLQIVRDLTATNEAALGDMARAIARPPSSTEEVGYYLSGSETPFENCFRKMASLLAATPAAASAEDKYTAELFDTWSLSIPLPEELTRAIGVLQSGVLVRTDARFDAFRRDFVVGVRALESRFAAAGTPLLSVDTGPGDTLLFLSSTTAAAERWRDVLVGVGFDGTPLAIRSPMWHRVWSHLFYGYDDARLEPPDGLTGPLALRSLQEVLPPL